MIFKTLMLVLGLLIVYRSDAATVRSTQSGDFNVGSTWVGGSVPENTDSVIIDSDHTVTVTVDDTVGSITIHSLLEERALLVVDPGVTLIVQGDVKLNSTDTDAESWIRLEGTMEIMGDLSFTPDSDPLWADFNMRYLNSTLILHGNISFADFGQIRVRDGYPSTIKFVGSEPQTMNINNDVAYYNVVFANTSGEGVTLGGSINTTNVRGNLTIETGVFDNNGYSIDGNDSTFTIMDGATFELSGTSSLPTGFNFDAQAGSEILFSGTNQTISSISGNFDDLTLNGSGTKILGSAITVEGDLTVASCTLDVDNIFNYNLNVQGDLDCSSGVLVPRNGTVTFNGTSTQNINSGSNTFYDLTVNNSGSGLTTTGDVNISNILTLTDGVITTDSDAIIITNTAGDAIAGFSDASFVYGNLRRYMTTNTDLYSFPVGDGTATTDYHLAQIKNQSLTGITYMDASFGEITNSSDNAMTATDPGLTYVKIMRMGSWVLEPDQQPTGGTYNIKLHTTNFNKLIDTVFAVLKRPVSSVSGADWSNGGGTINPIDSADRFVATGYALRKGLSDFSEFGIGQSTHPLPIELLNFSASYDEGRVILDWTTSIEINNAYFTIERSIDGSHFDGIIETPGAGNSLSPIEYQEIDTDPNGGWNYYRLRQTDFDGTSESFHIIPVLVDKQDLINLTVYPNILQSGSTITIQVQSEISFDGIQMKLYELSTGIAVQEFTIEEGTQSLYLNSNLAAGSYILRSEDDRYNLDERIIIW